VFRFVEKSRQSTEKTTFAANDGSSGEEVSRIEPRIFSR
jgi:hypothetical protein